MSASSEVTQLPGGWAATRLGDIADTQLGKMLSQKARTGIGSKPYLRNANVQWGSFDLTDVSEMDFTETEREKFRLRAGDILVCEGGEVGRAAIWRNHLPECYFQKALHRVRPHGGVSAQFIQYLLHHYGMMRAFDRFVTGSTIAHLPQEDLRQLPVPLPPTAEQERIVSVIEEQFSRLDAGVESLERAERNLTRLRAALLSAAVEGRLVDQCPNDEPAEDLLKRIQETQRGIARKSTTRMFPARDLVPRPVGWSVASIDMLAAGRANAVAIGPFGSSLKVSDYRLDGVPLVFVRNVRTGRFAGPDTKFVGVEKATDLKSHLVRAGDVLVTKMGDPPGDAIVYPAGMPDAIITADVIKITPHENIDGDFIALAINSPPVRKMILQITKGVAQLKVSLERFRSEIVLPIPPLSEQQRIVAEVERQFSMIEHQEAAIAQALEVSRRLRSSILSWAFSGRLLAQDPHSIPANAFLSEDAGPAEPPIRGGRDSTT